MLRFNVLDRLIFVGLYRLFPDVRDALAVGGEMFNPGHLCPDRLRQAPEGPRRR
jgi:hypothetical protein